MSESERSILNRLDVLLRSPKVRAQIQVVVKRVRNQLTDKKDALMTWESIPLTIYGDALPPKIRSSWVFVLCAGADTGAERHPNSHQRMMTIEGTGDMRIGEKSPWAERSTADAESKIQWKSNILVSNSDAPLSRRWVSIPPNVWHRPVVGPDAHWVVVSFHTVRAEELIEERPDSDVPSETRQMRYLEQSRD
jgi:hypothetical protein